ncbi:MAG: transporter substrate-binding domain-containing protein [Anaerolineae bacterium]|nr:transporter substrate-binding domain-containing protein [Anaerolineae bacterium]
MKKIILLIFICMFASLGGAVAQEAIPTLVPPTPLPTVPSPQQDALRSQSVVSHLQENGVVRIGILFNEPPYGQLDVRGVVAGYDADLARAIAEVWGVEIEFVQVTRQNRLDMLMQDRVDMLLAAMIHERELDQAVEFSQSYRVSRQALLVREDDPAVALQNMVGRRIGYVIGTAADEAVQHWLSTTGQGVQAQPYFTIDEAYRALFATEIDGIVGRLEHLRRVSSNNPEAVKIIDEPVVLEPYAIAVPRQDVAMRNLVDRTLQYLVDNDTLPNLHETFFPGEGFPYDVIPVWDNLGENGPTPANFATDIPYPSEYRAARIIYAEDRVLRVAGLQELPQDAPESERRLLAFYQGLLTQFAERWGARLEIVQGDPVSLIESGAADLAVGVNLDWSLADRIDFSQPFLMHGDRMMVPTNRDITSFLDLRGRWVGVIAGDGDSEARAQYWIDSIGARINLFTINFEGNIPTTMFDTQNVDVVFGDSLRLIPHVQADPSRLELTERWYTRKYEAFALPRNDIDFRLLVDYTLQEMQRDGTLASLSQPVFPPDTDFPGFPYWPGSSDYLGLSLAP